MKKLISIIILSILFASISDLKSTSLASQTQDKSVYIVPDIETFLYTLSTWDRHTRFPIFIGVNRYTEKFLRAYPDYAVIKAPAAHYVDLTEETVLKALYASWGPETLFDIKKKITPKDIKKRLRKMRVQPQGIVFTDIEDRECAGGLLLAAYHKQCLEFLDINIEKLLTQKEDKKYLNNKAKETIRLTIIKKIAAWGYPYKGLGTGIDYITLALQFPFSYQGGNSLDDAINRIEPQSTDCYSYVGRLVDNNLGMALYQANASVFLPTSSAFFFDTWPEKWNYRMGCAYWFFLQHIPSILYEGTTGRIDAWRSIMKFGNFFNFIFVQSSGSSKSWAGTVDDIPDSVPVIVYFSHSYSAANFYDPQTIAGRWLANGAYIYLGSINEPMNAAFQKSIHIASAIKKNYPLGKAFQRKEYLMKNFAKPWRLIYIGDPLCKIRFKVNTSQSVSFSQFKIALETLINANLALTCKKLEQFIKYFPRSILCPTALDLLNKTYLLQFYEYNSQKYPLQKSMTVTSTRNWFLQLSAQAKTLYTNLTYIHDLELKHFYMHRYYYVKDNPYIKHMLKEKIKSLNKTVPYIKEWALAGPFTLAQGVKHETLLNPTFFSIKKPIMLDNTLYPWKPTYAKEKNNMVELKTKSTSKHLFAYACTLVSSKGNRIALLKVTTQSRFILFVNNQKIFDNFKVLQTKRTMYPLRMQLKDGRNFILIKTYKGKENWEFSAGIYTIGEKRIKTVFPIHMSLLLPKTAHAQKNKQVAPYPTLQSLPFTKGLQNNHIPIDYNDSQK
ncbi:MAG: hypothetical protein P9M13_10560 [Candidatus Ancaeobacter aquaticus]|nr:hypothetical protein [Candidatus Ancaeobacter aquaticus]